MNDKINEEVFREMVESAKTGKSMRSHSADMALIWAAKEIESLRALVANQEPPVTTQDLAITDKATGLDWDDFKGGDDGDFNLGDTKPVDAPSACSLDDPSCESCQ